MSNVGKAWARRAGSHMPAASSRAQMARAELARDIHPLLATRGVPLTHDVAAGCAILDAVKAGVPHFIFSSTAATYGIPDVAAVSEDTPQRPINPYGWSKLMTEQMLADVAAAHPMNFGVLRYFNVAGADPQARSGQSTAGATHLIKVAIEAALGMRESVSVFGTDYASNAAEAVSNFVVTNPLPAAVRLAPDADPALTVSVDGGKTFGALAALTITNSDGTTRPAAHADVTHVRWVLASIAPGEKGRLSYPAIIR